MRMTCCGNTPLTPVSRLLIAPVDGSGDWPAWIARVARACAWNANFVLLKSLSEMASCHRNVDHVCIESADHDCRASFRSGPLIASQAPRRDRSAHQLDQILGVRARTAARRLPRPSRTGMYWIARKHAWRWHRLPLPPRERHCIRRNGGTRDPADRRASPC